MCVPFTLVSFSCIYYGASISLKKFSSSFHVAQFTFYCMNELLFTYYYYLLRKILEISMFGKYLEAILFLKSFEYTLSTMVYIRKELFYKLIKQIFPKEATLVCIFTNNEEEFLLLPIFVRTLCYHCLGVYSF